MNNVIRFKTKAELAAESRRDDIEYNTGIRANVISHDELMKLEPDPAVGAIKVYQDYYNDPANKAAPR